MSSNTNNVEKSTFKIALVGDAGVGKTTFINRHRTGEFEKKYIATIGVEVHNLAFNTTRGIITFNIWDCAGQEKFCGLKHSYYEGADLAIVMFDLTSIFSLRNVPEWVAGIRRVCPKIPIILLGNKCDEKEALKTKRVKNFIDEVLTYYPVSAMTNYNFEKPFLAGARQVWNDPKLQFVMEPAIFPVTPTPNTKAPKEQWENEMVPICEGVTITRKKLMELYDLHC